MPGLYGVVSKKEVDLHEKIYTYFYSSKHSETLNEELRYKNFLYGRSVINKFLNDRVLYEDKNLIIAFEGVYFNKKSILTSNEIANKYKKNSINFIKDIKGEFSGFIYDKQLDKLFLYNDHLSTKPIYYYKDNDYFIFASEFKVITKLLQGLAIEKVLDYDGVYSMLTFGYMLGELTFEKQTKKLDYATILEIDSELEITKHKYFRYEKKENFNLTKKEIIENIDKLLVSSIDRCWKKDKEYGYSHLSFLSGGLDSRVNVLLAKQLGYTNTLTMTFSQSGSSDEKIAQEISNKEGFKHIFYSLNNGKFLEANLEKYIEANDGLVNLTGSAAGYAFLSTINFKHFGALHTGQIGDLLFGSYVKKSFDVSSGIMSNQKELLKKISSFVEFRKKYNDNSEIFGYEQRVINGALNGDRTVSHYVDMVSPFYDRELIEFCLTIPDKYKKDEAIYLDWFNKKHKKVSQYKWESAGIKPRYSKIVNIAKIIKRYKNAILRRIGFNINDMNPFDIWMRQNKKILKTLDKYFEDNINNIDDLQLKEQLSDMYKRKIEFSHYGRNNKYLVVTLLLALNLHFGKTK
ncbi:asparagine synthase-related protein [Sulfurimonas aquatica]|uniref:asparagine synthase-related protein n=1 Tax=Sulfurimonas aquatica TaxID=2672570 RepID=UPI001A98D37F|nr:asparagine synthase-related protein [Sulfurimonas aquatica]